MKIIVHRGTHQIGGCSTEIATKTSRIVIDFGSELDGNQSLDVDSVTKGISDCKAVLFTHYHGDHIGLLESINSDIPLFIGELSLDILKLQNARQKIYAEEVIDRIKPYITGKEMIFGDITVTPYMVDHSAFDSHMFLIEAEGKKILHTGDFRAHGFRGKGLLPTLKKYVGEVDVIICEGTTIGRGTIKSLAESELLCKAKTIFDENKYVFIVCASTNVDRIAAFCSAVPRGKYCICDGYQRSILDVVREKSGKYSSLYAFPKILTYSSRLDEKMKNRGFCMFIRPGNYLSDKLLEQYKDMAPLVVYSMWHGYLEQNDSLTKKLSEYRIEELHTSGHADMGTIENVIKAVKPKVVVPIHTNNPERFSFSAHVKVLEDEEEMQI